MYVHFVRMIQAIFRWEPLTWTRAESFDYGHFKVSLSLHKLKVSITGIFLVSITGAVITGRTIHQYHRLGPQKKNYTLHGASILSCSKTHLIFPSFQFSTLNFPQFVSFPKPFVALMLFRKHYWNRKNTICLQSTTLVTKHLVRGLAHGVWMTAKKCGSKFFVHWNGIVSSDLRVKQNLSFDYAVSFDLNNILWNKWYSPCCCLTSLIALTV